MKRKAPSLKTDGEKGSRTALLLFAVFSEAAACVLLPFFLSIYFYPLRLLFYLSALLSLVHLQSRSLPWSLKYPWAVFLLLFPAVGVTFYFLFSRSSFSRKKSALLREIYCEGSPFFTADVTLKSDYLSRETGFLPFYGSKAIYYPTGEEFFPALKEDLKSAKRFVFLEYFILAEGELWSEIEKILTERASVGVEVKVLFDGFGSLKRLRKNFIPRLRQKGIEAVCFSPARALTRSLNNRDHRKIAVIDGEIAFVGGSNIGDEYDNRVKRFGVWKDCTLRVFGEAALPFTLFFLETYSLAQKRVMPFSRYLSRPSLSFENEESFVRPYADGPSPAYADPISENLYLHLINGAKKSLQIMTPYFIADECVFRALAFAVKRGVEVSVFLPGVPDKKGVYLLTKRSASELQKSGVYVYVYTLGFLHSKLLLADEKEAIVGTANFDYRSFRHHYECGAYLFQGEAIKAIAKDFEKTKGECRLFDENDRLTRSQKICADVGVFLSPLL